MKPRHGKYGEQLNHVEDWLIEMFMALEACEHAGDLRRLLRDQYKRHGLPVKMEPRDDDSPLCEFVDAQAELNSETE